MRSAFLVAWREYVENAKTKGFWIGLFIFPAILFLAIQIPVFLEKKGTPARHFVIVDQSGQFEMTIDDALETRHQRRVLQELNDYVRKHAQPKGEVESAGGTLTLSAEGRDLFDELAETSPEGVARFIRRGGKDYYLRELGPRLRPSAPEFRESRREFRRVLVPADVDANTELATVSQALRPYLRGEKRVRVEGRPAGLFAAVLIPRDIERQVVRPGILPASKEGSSAGVEYWSINLADESLRDEIQRAVNAEIRRREYLKRGLDLALVQQVEGTRVPFSSLNPKKQEGKEKVSGADVVRQWAPAAFVYLLWLSIFTIMQMLLNNVIEEKSNRIIEVLLSSVRPGELMMGKLAGIAAIGLTMVGAWIASLLGLLAWKSAGQTEVAQLYTVIRTSNLVPVFFIYFFLGYLMYAALILALGSVCNTLKDAQNYMGVITMIMMVPVLTMMFIPKDPNGTVATVLSWIPLYTPFVMMNRAAADPPLLDLIGTMVLLMVSTLAALWMAVKIFRIGVLRTGQPPKLVEMLRWLKT